LKIKTFIFNEKMNLKDDRTISISITQIIIWL